MVQAIPTFTSTSVTQTPSMGVVAQSGTRAMGEAFGRVGNFFDTVAEYSNDKLDQKMKREMTIAGQEMAMSKGFDPNELNEDPFTTADMVLRESALNTYAITLESDIERSINRAHVENLRNPNGFKAQTDGYISKTVGEVPTELKNGVSKMALGMANSKFASIKIETAMRSIAEAEASEKIFLERIGDKIVLAETPEERAILMNKIDGMLANSTAYMTQGGRDAARAQLIDRVYTDDAFKKVMEGQLTPLEAKNKLEGNGVLVDQTTMSQFYSSSMQKINFEEAQIERSEKARSDVAKKISNQYLIDMYDAKQGGADSMTFDIIMESSLDAMRQNGAEYTEIMTHKKSMTDTIYGDGTDNPQAIMILNEMSFNADPDGIDKVDEMFISGMIGGGTRQKYIEDFTKATSDIITNPIIKGYKNEYINKFAPFGNLRAEDAELYAMSGTGPTEIQIAQDKMKVQELENRIITLNQEGKNAGEIASILRGETSSADPIPNSARANIAMGKDNFMEVDSILSSNQFNLWVVQHSNGEDSLVQRTIDDGPWTQDNWKNRLKMMLDEQQRSYRAGIKQPYSEETLKDIYDGFNTK